MSGKSLKNAGLDLFLRQLEVLMSRLRRQQGRRGTYAARSVLLSVGTPNLNPYGGSRVYG